MTATAKMNWLEAPTKQGFAVYELWDDENKLMTFEFNQFSQTAKIVCLNSRRVFRIEKEGFLRNKTIFKNEYGVKIGELLDDGWFSNEGTIVLHDEKFHFNSNAKQAQKIFIYQKVANQPLIVCDIDKRREEVNFNFIKHAEADKHSTLLMALLWYLFLPVVKEQSALLAGL